MRRHPYRCLLLLLAAAILSGGRVSAEETLNGAALQGFTAQCWPSTDYDLLLKFAPVKPAAAGSAPRWSYEYANTDEAYPGNRIKLPPDKAVPVDLVLTLRKSESPLGEGYLWLVIIGPTVNGWIYGGHWPIDKPINTFDRLSAKRESLIHMVSLSTHQGQPVHTKISFQDIDNSGTLNAAWEDLFGSRIFADLVYPATKGARSGKAGYALTFYHVPTPAPRLINENGFRWNATKHIDKPGIVYGFALLPGGGCLASASVEVVR